MTLLLLKASVPIVLTFTGTFIFVILLFIKALAPIDVVLFKFNVSIEVFLKASVSNIKTLSDKVKSPRLLAMLLKALIPIVLTVSANVILLMLKECCYMMKIQ